ncbi:hypothetical protein ABIE48_001816 [Paenibacillus sp. OAE614]
MNYSEKITLFTEPMPGRLFRFQFLSESLITSSLNDKKAPFRRKPSNIACGKGATVCCSRRWFIQLITLP